MYGESGLVRINDTDILQMGRRPLEPSTHPPLAKKRKERGTLSLKKMDGPPARSP
jgi:hypothetical protein